MMTIGKSRIGASKETPPKPPNGSAAEIMRAIRAKLIADAQKVADDKRREDQKASQEVPREP